MKLRMETETDKIVVQAVFDLMEHAAQLRERQIEALNEMLRVYKEHIDYLSSQTKTVIFQALSVLNTETVKAHINKGNEDDSSRTD